MDEQAPSVLDRIGEERRSKFDHNLARVLAKSLGKRVDQRYQSADEMHEAVYGCLVDRGEAIYRCGGSETRPPLHPTPPHPTPLRMSCSLESPSELKTRHTPFDGVVGWQW